MDVALNVSSLDFTSGLAEYLRGGHVYWAYALLAVTTAPPLVPNAVLLVTGGVMAAEGRLNLALVLLVVAGSAVMGDLLIHRAGHAVSGRVLRRMKRRPRQAALLRWAAVRIQRHGVPFVIGIRFLPSGRVIGGLAAGIVRYPARRYAVGAGVAEAVWASYSVGAGYFSGRAASNDFYALSLGVGVSVLVGAAGTVAQWTSRARERRLLRGPGGFVRPSAVVAASLAGESGTVAVPMPTPPASNGATVASVPPDGGPKIGPPSASPEGKGSKDRCPCSRGFAGRGK
ncbi:DedA family protein [Actinacidiphila sp. ITFR-21]|uniref:DedA family protein n=1 Tax=Actinacidiphila sp. ITFR-21 TaxID=3075199 RepID=UPI00288B3809|nr:VTT domain-containing protein [Streptomyces sp. ITFR-21]WNI15609.1 VTT domain-containing protein [Streptomyces sp. ITFR-21]